MSDSRAWVSVLLLVGLLAGTVGAVDIATVLVGNVGNPADTLHATPGYGSVGYTYQMGKYDVTAGQYCEFLNAVARTDTHGLYKTSMGDPYTLDVWGCNIQRAGTSGSYTYSVASDWANRPVNFVSWGDAARFANWLSNGQPTGGQNPSTTEDGSYALNGATSNSALMAVTRKANATWVIPSEDEWYKAAYYDPDKLGGAGYWNYPTRSDWVPSNIFSATGTNNANYYDYYGVGNGGYTIGAPYYRTEVGAFASSPSAYDTYDQGGNVFQWNETAVSGSSRGLRGGSFYSYGDGDLWAATRCDYPPSVEIFRLGFRLAYVPEPGCGLFFAGGGLALLRRRARR